MWLLSDGKASCFNRRMKTLQQQLNAVANLSHFVEKTGLPRRTLNRIRAGAKTSTMTARAVSQALKTYKAPKK